MSRSGPWGVYTGVKDAWTGRTRKAGAMLLLVASGVAGMATSPARRALHSVCAFASYYEALGTTVHPNAWDRVTLSAMLAVADSTDPGHPSCGRQPVRP